MNRVNYMIGDCVQITDHKHKIKGYARDNGVEWTILFYEDGQPDDDLVNVSYEPIPITPIILEANGIKHYKNCGSLSYYKRDLEGFVIRYETHSGYLSIDAGDNYITANNITKVHELQQLLRLKGLTDFADNFIIKTGGAI